MGLEYGLKNSAPRLSYIVKSSKNSTESLISKVAYQGYENESYIIKSRFDLFKQMIFFPFIAVVAGDNVSMSMLITKALASFIKLYSFLIFVKIVQSWFLVIEQDSQPWIFLRQVTNPYLNIFQDLIPPLMGQLDLSPILGLLLLQFISNVLMAPFEAGPEYW